MSRTSALARRSPAFASVLLVSCTLILPSASSPTGDPQADGPGGGSGAGASLAAPARACERETGPTPVDGGRVAFSQLARALGSAAPGTSLVLEPGTYTEPLHLKARGRADAPIVVRADPPGSVRFSGAGQLELSGNHFTVSGFDFDRGVIPPKSVAVLFRACRHCRVTDCKIRRYLPSEGNKVHWVRFTTGHHNRIDHCEIHDKYDFREMVRVTHFTEGFDRIDHNYIHDFIKDPPLNGGEALRLGSGRESPTRTTVDHNLFERIRAEQEIISVKSHQNHFHHNTFRDSFAELTLRWGNDNVVEQNVFIASPEMPGRGVRVYGRGHRVEGNHFSGLMTGIRLGAGSADGKCYTPADAAVVRGNRFTAIEKEEVQVDFMLGWDRPNCPVTDLPARNQVLEDNTGPADTARAYRAEDPCIGPTW